MPAPKQSVASFNLCLDGYSDILKADEPVRAIEDRLMQQLDQPARLLRWAIVRVSGSRFWCEGAYLKDVSMR